jgi:hypothetical protein
LRRTLVPWTSTLAELAALYSRDEVFRSRVVMARHGFRRGRYQYFKYPLPDLLASLRSAIYARLAPIANRWRTCMVNTSFRCSWLCCCPSRATIFTGGEFVDAA